MRLNKKTLFDFLNRSKGSYFANKRGWVLPKIYKKQKSVRLVFRKSCKSPDFCHACNKEIVIFKMLLFAYCKHGKRMSFYEFYKKTPSLKDDVFYIFLGKPQSPFLKKIISKIATRIFFHQYFLTTIIDFYFVH